jgi:gas vesicle protein
MSEHNDNFFKGLLLGGVIGAVAGILFAPKAGREIRQEISDETDKLVNKLKADLEKAKVTFEEGKQKIMETLNMEKVPEQPIAQNNMTEESPAAETRKKTNRR